MAYPYGKLDVAVVPRFWGTMEHPGLVAMGQPLTLIRPEQETRERKQRYANILAHELAHYWFGDYVTMAWWDDTWLNEALGEWMDSIITDAAEPGWKVLDGRVARAAGAMSATRRCRRSRSASRSRRASRSRASFDGAITYLKGTTVIAHVRDVRRGREVARLHARLHGEARVGQRDRGGPVRRGARAAR